MASLDAAAWDEQHTADELNMTTRLMCGVVRHFNKDVTDELDSLADKLDSAQRKKVVVDGDSQYVVEGTCSPVRV